VQPERNVDFLSLSSADAKIEEEQSSPVKASSRV
jgi:hypothetical protein